MAPAFLSSACPHDGPSTWALEVERLDNHTIGKAQGAADQLGLDRFAASHRWNGKVDYPLFDAVLKKGDKSD